MTKAGYPAQLGGRGNGWKRELETMGFLKKVLYFATVLVLVLASIETGLRLLGYSGEVVQKEPSSGLSLLVPNTKFQYIRECITNEVTTNSMGFHDRVWPLSKSKGVFRIAVIGDELVQALPIALEKTFPRILEDRLNAELKGSPKIEVQAFGEAGNGTFMNWLVWQRFASRFKPDLVIHALNTANDFVDDSPEMILKRQPVGGRAVERIFPQLNHEGHMEWDETLRPKSNPVAEGRHFWEELFYQSATGHWFLGKWGKIQAMKSADNQAGSLGNFISEGVPIDQQFMMAVPPPEWEKMGNLEKEMIRHFRQSVEKEGAHYLLVALPDIYRVERQYLHSDYWQVYSFDLEKPEKILQGIADDDQTGFVPLFSTFKMHFEQSHEPLSFPCEKTWNERAHQWAGEALAATILKSGFISR